MLASLIREGLRTCRALIAVCVVATNVACRERREPTALGALALEGYSDRNTDGKVLREEYGTFKLGAAAEGTTQWAPDFLLLHVVYAWCQYCATESDAEASWLRQEPRKIAVIQVLVESADGHRPTLADLNLWVDRAHGASSIRFPSALDRPGTCCAPTQSLRLYSCAPKMDSPSKLRCKGREASSCYARRSGARAKETALKARRAVSHNGFRLM
jgi:hypothetical protein